MADRRVLRLAALSIFAGVLFAYLLRIPLRFGAGILLVVVRQPSSSVVGLALSVATAIVAEGVAGHTAGRLAGKYVPFAPLVVGLIDTAIAVAFVVMRPAAVPWWWYALALVVIAPSAVVGGTIGRRAGLTSAST